VRALGILLVLALGACSSNGQSSPIAIQDSQDTMVQEPIQGDTSPLLLTFAERLQAGVTNIESELTDAFLAENLGAVFVYRDTIETWGSINTYASPDCNGVNYLWSTAISPNEISAPHLLVAGGMAGNEIDLETYGTDHIQVEVLYAVLTGIDSATGTTFEERVGKTLALSGGLCRDRDYYYDMQDTTQWKDCVKKYLGGSDSWVTVVVDEVCARGITSVTKLGYVDDISILRSRISEKRQALQLMVGAVPRGDDWRYGKMVAATVNHWADKDVSLVTIAYVSTRDSSSRTKEEIMDAAALAANVAETYFIDKIDAALAG